MTQNRPLSHLPWLFGLCCLLSPVVYGGQSDFNKQVVIQAKRQTSDLKENTVTFVDQVRVKQGTLHINAEQLVVHQAGDGHQEVLIATGKPAHYQQQLDNGQLLKASANEIKYELQNRTLSLVGKAQIQQQESVVKGEKIVYNLNTQRLEAESGSNNSDSVTTIFTPEKVQEQLDNETPQQNKEP